MQIYPIMMEEARTERNLKKPFSFSIDQILNRDDLKRDDCKRSTISSCCPSSHCKDESPREPKPVSPLRTYRPAFVACRHPICSIPASPVVHTDPYHDLHQIRSYHKYTGFVFPPHSIYHGSYIRMKETFPYENRLLGYSREPGISSFLWLCILLRNFFVKVCIEHVGRVFLAFMNINDVCMVCFTVIMRSICVKPKRSILKPIEKAMCKSAIKHWVMSRSVNLCLDYVSIAMLFWSIN